MSWFVNEDQVASGGFTFIFIKDRRTANTLQLQFRKAMPGVTTDVPCFIGVRNRFAGTKGF